MGTSTAVQKARTVADTDVPLTIATHEATQAIIAPLLPKGVTFDQVAAQVRLALAKDTKGDLKKCTVGSVILSVAKICGWGLEVGVTAHLVPFGDQCSALRDYTGDIQLAIEAGLVRHVESYVVYANEPFKMIRGTESLIEHRPIATPEGRGKMVGVYALIYLRGAHQHVVVEHMTIEEVDAIRQQYSKQWKSGPVPRWYMKKTVIRQGLKLLPKSPKTRTVLAELEREGLNDAAELDERLSIGELPAPSADAPRVHRIEGPKALADGEYDGTPSSAALVGGAVGAGAPATCTRCGQPHRAGTDGEDLGNGDGSCFRFTAAE